MYSRPSQQRTTGRSTAGARPSSQLDLSTGHDSVRPTIPPPHGAPHLAVPWSRPPGSPHIVPAAQHAAVTAAPTVHGVHAGLPSVHLGSAPQQMDHFVQGARHPAGPSNFAMPSEYSQRGEGLWSEDAALFQHVHMSDSQGAFIVPDAWPNHSGYPRIANIYPATNRPNAPAARTYTPPAYAHASLAQSQTELAHSQALPASTSMAPFFPPSSHDFAVQASTPPSVLDADPFTSFSQNPSLVYGARMPNESFPGGQYDTTPRTPVMRLPSILGPSRNVRTPRSVPSHSPYPIPSPLPIRPLSTSAASSTIPSALIPSRYRCGWRGKDDSKCPIPLDDLSPSGISRHLKDHHGISRQSHERTKCRWAGCPGKRIQHASMGKHVASIHLRLKNEVECDYCPQRFGREDACLRHMKKQHREEVAGRPKAQKYKRAHSRSQHQ